MSINNRYLVFAFFSLLLAKADAQSISKSPYSRYGLGDILDNSIAQSQALGGVSQGFRSSTWINYSNPASYSSLELSTFQTSVNLSITEQSTAASTQKVKNGNLASLAFGIPLKKGWGLSFGLLPFSSIGYKFSNFSTAPNGEEVQYLYNGSGGLNKVFLGTGISPFINKSDSSWLKGFSLGINASYIFGNMTYERRAIFTDANTQLNNLRDIDYFKIGDFDLDYGIQYRANLKKKWSLISGITLSTATKLHAEHSGLGQTYTVINDFESAKDTVYSFQNVKGNIQMPTRLGFGILANKSDKLMIGADFKTQDWSKFSSFGVKDSLNNSNSISLGVQYIPNPSSGRGFWKHVQYRAGVNYSTTYLKIRNTLLTQQSVNFGAGFPIIKSLSTLNVAFQYGVRGTTTDNLVKEKFYGLSVGLTFSDKWFIKRKFD